MRTLSVGTKLAYGTGSMAFAAKDAAFVNFVMFYYTQVVGLPGTLTGLAAAIALVSDAFSDPIVGSVSDNHRSAHWGRRHPFMAASAVPLAVCFYFLFTPPDGLGTWASFAWLTGWAILLRTALTVFAIPHAALGAELSQDYEERSIIVGYRTILGWAAGVILPAFALQFMFSTGDGSDGRLYAPNYVTYAIFSAGIVLVAIAISTWFTRKEIAHLPQVLEPQHAFEFSRPFVEMWHALGNRNFRWLFIALLFVGASTGVAITLGFYMNTYFWEFTAEQMAALGLFSLAATVVIFFLLPAFSRRFEKQSLFVSGLLILVVNISWFTTGRLVDVLPANGTTAIFVFAMANGFVTVAGVMLLQVIGPSMVADMVDEHEVETGERKEGVFFAALGFSTKAVSGFGTLIGGIVIDTVGLPTGAEPGSVPSEVLIRLGIVVGPLIAASLLIPLALVRQIHLPRERHEELQAVLASRAAADA